MLGRRTYSNPGSGLPLLRYEDGCVDAGPCTTLRERNGGGVWMRAKLNGWKHVLFAAAALATLALAAGARYKPN
jgi:hypothetical protein